MAKVAPIYFAIEGERAKHGVVYRKSHLTEYGPCGFLFFFFFSVVFVIIVLLGFSVLLVFSVFEILKLMLLRT